MTLLLKDPEATLDYSVDWGSDYLSDDSLATSEWTVAPDAPGGAAIVGSSFDALTASVEVAGGAPGVIYRLTNHVTTASGRADSRSIMLRLEKR